jgi:hypothetical protein
VIRAIQPFMLPCEDICGVSFRREVLRDLTVFRKVIQLTPAPSQEETDSRAQRCINPEKVVGCGISEYSKQRHNP